MVNIRSLLILIAVTAVLGFFAFWDDKPEDAISTEALNAQILLPSLAAQINNVTKIQVQTNAETFSIEKQENTWVIPSKDKHPANVTEIGNFLLGMASLKKVEAKTSKAENFSQLEVNTPLEDESKATQISVFADEDKILTDLIAGKSRIARSDSNERETYVREQGKDQVWLVQGDWEIKKTTNDWLHTKVLNLGAADVASVVVNHPRGESVEISKDTAEAAEYQLAHIPDEQKIRYQFALNDIAGVFSGLTFDDVRSRDGLSFEGVTGVVTGFDGLKISFTTAEQDDASWFAFAAAVDKDDLKERVQELNDRWKNWAYRLPDFKKNNILKPMSELIEAKEPPAEADTPLAAEKTDGG
ncbi:MAG: DUF4340 domain-containing protein [Arenicellales bacterium WSBS_2016_MAG_OTU3]